MKRVVGLVMVIALSMLMLSASCTGLAEDAELVEFEPGLTNTFGYDGRTWFSTEENRATLTGALIIDLTLAIGDSGLSFPDWTDTTFIGRHKLEMNVFAHGEEKDFLIFYKPLQGTAAYWAMEPVSDTVMEDTFASVCGEDSYYENDPEAIAEFYQAFREIIAGDDN